MIDKRLACVAGLTVLVSFAMLTIIRSVYPIEPRFHHNVSSPVLALELARNAEEIRSVLPDAGYRPSDRERAEDCELPRGVLQGSLEDRTDCPAWDKDAHRALLWNTVLDLLFIPLYVLYLIYFSHAISDVAQFLKQVLWLAITAGLFDYLEDGFIFAALQGRALPIYIPSLVKWLALGVALLLIAFRLMGTHKHLFSVATDRLLGLQYLIAGGSIVCGVILSHWWEHALIQAGVYVWGILVAVTALCRPILWCKSLLKPDVLVYEENFCDGDKPFKITPPAVHEAS